MKPNKRLIQDYVRLLKWHTVLRVDLGRRVGMVHLMVVAVVVAAADLVRVDFNLMDVTKSLLLEIK
jgi:hypothetical protein